jgi:hypothetical protein
LGKATVGKVASGERWEGTGWNGGREKVSKERAAKGAPTPCIAVYAIFGHVRECRSYLRVGEGGGGGQLVGRVE